MSLKTSYDLTDSMNNKASTYSFIYTNQTAEDARLMMRHLDKNLGKPLPEKSYGGNCLIYDPSNDDPWHNFKVG